MERGSGSLLIARPDSRPGAEKGSRGGADRAAAARPKPCSEPAAGSEPKPAIQATHYVDVVEGVIEWTGGRSC